MVTVLKQLWPLQLADMVEKRAEQGRNYGVVLVPEGLIEFVPEVGRLIAELNELLADNNGQPSAESVTPRLSDASRRVRYHIILTMNIAVINIVIVIIINIS